MTLKTDYDVKNGSRYQNTADWYKLKTKRNNAS